MTAEERLAIAEDALARSRADATEITVTSERRALMRFTREAVCQNVDCADVVVRVRALADGRIGVASTNAVDVGALEDVVERARAVALLAPRERLVPQFAAGNGVASPDGLFIPQTADAPPQTRAAIAGDIFAHAKRGGLWSSGFATTVVAGSTIVTSTGARRSYDETDAGVNAKFNAEDATGFAEAYSRDVRSIDGDAVGREAARIANATRKPLPVEPGPWTVILMPAAAGELMRYVADHFSAEMFADGSSFVSGKLGAQLLGDNVSIDDDYTHPLHPGRPFDHEGYPTQRVALVRNGVPENVVTDSSWSRRLERSNTGHAVAVPTTGGPQAESIVVAPGSRSVDEMVAKTARGLIVTRLWYVRVVDARTLLLTGMTRDGTFLVENGVVRGGVRNMRFNMPMVEALRDCEMSDAQQRTGGYHYSLVTPAIAFRSFRFTSVSPY